MSRIDLYSPVHKAIRVLLFDAVEAVGRTDFQRAAELPALLANVRRTIRLTRLHAQHEDREIQPILHRVAAHVAADLEAAHDRFDGAEREIAACLDRIETAPQGERATLGRRLHETLGRLAADQLLHMSLEESRGNRALWAHLTNVELQALHGRLVAGIGPEEMSEWLELMLPAANLTERAELVAGLRGAAPAEVFAGLTGAARARLGEECWSETLEAADVVVAGRAAQVEALP